MVAGVGEVELEKQPELRGTATAGTASYRGFGESARIKPQKVFA
jgi:hypothetical protein